MEILQSCPKPLMYVSSNERDFYVPFTIPVNSLAPGRSECDSENVIFILVLLIGIFRSSHDNALRWMPQDLTDDQSTLVQVMAWCRQATSHYLSQCWPRSLLPYCVTRPQWVKLPWMFPGAPLTFNEAPGNIQGNLTGMTYFSSCCACWRFSSRCSRFTLCRCSESFVLKSNQDIMRYTTCTAAKMKWNEAGHYPRQLNECVKHASVSDWRSVELMTYRTTVLNATLGSRWEGIAKINEIKGKYEFSCTQKTFSNAFSQIQILSHYWCRWQLQATTVPIPEPRMTKCWDTILKSNLKESRNYQFGNI